MSHKKFGPDRFSRFDVYWIQTNKQTDKQTDKPNLYIDKLLRHVLKESEYFVKNCQIVATLTQNPNLNSV